MDNSLSKINQINFLAESASHDQNTSKLKDKKDQDLINVANQFEAIFVHQMLKQARQGKLADGIFNSEAQDTFNNMLDIEYSQITLPLKVSLLSGQIEAVSSPFHLA